MVSINYENGGMVLLSDKNGELDIPTRPLTEQDDLEQTVRNFAVSFITASLRVLLGIGIAR